jgi:hypothetical protein
MEPSRSAVMISSQNRTVVARTVLNCPPTETDRASTLRKSRPCESETKHRAGNNCPLSPLLRRAAKRRGEQKGEGKAVIRQ